ncbi:MAG TPA: ABC transporter permease subunit [Thermoplasmata archaeon]|nr:ABC transporter permease subunit [Thermoplasmata archaeon]
MTRSREGWAPLAPIVVFVLAFALLPVVLLFAGSVASVGGGSGVATVLSDPLDRQAISNSLFQGGLSAGLAVALGYPAGLFVGRYSWPGRSLVRSVLLVPFLLPSLVVVLGVEDLFGGGGLISSSLPGASFFGSGIPGIVVANLVFNVPLVVLLTATGCEVGSRDLEETVATLGGSPTRAYRDAWGRPTWVGAAAGGLLTFLFSALSFAPPLLLCGERCYTVEARIWSLDQVFLDPGGAGVLALAMVGLFLAPTLLYLLLVRGLRPAAGRRPPEPRPIPRNSLAVGFLAVETVAVLGAVATVLAAVLYRTVQPYGGGGPGAAWSALFSSATSTRIGIGIPGALTNTLLFAGAAAGIALLLVIPAAYAIGRRAGRGAGLGVLLFVPLLVSPIVLAFSLATFWRPLLGGEGTVWALVIVSQAVLALPFALQTLSIPLSGLSAGVREAAQSLGATRFGAFLDADLPRVRDGLITAGLLAFALGLGEFTATFFLVTPRFTTLPVALYGLANTRQLPIADAAAGLLLVLSLAIFLVLSAGGRRVEL